MRERSLSRSSMRGTSMDNIAIKEITTGNAERRSRSRVYKCLSVDGGEAIAGHKDRDESPKVTFREREASVLKRIRKPIIPSTIPVPGTTICKLPNHIFEAMRDPSPATIVRRLQQSVPTAAEILQKTTTTLHDSEKYNMVHYRDEMDVQSMDSSQASKGLDLQWDPETFQANYEEDVDEYERIHNEQHRNQLALQMQVKEMAEQIEEMRMIEQQRE